jgi:hypothetical protein
VLCGELQRLRNEYKAALAAYGKTAGAYLGGTDPSVDAGWAAASAVSVRLLRMREQLERHIREHGCASESPVKPKTESTDRDARKKIRPAVMRVHPPDEGT